jgi:lipid A 3-O-deacylase
LSSQLVTGSLFSTKFPNGHEHTLDYWQTNLRLECALNQPGPEESFFRGNFEALLEITGSIIYRGPGTYLVGGTALLRYNFVQPEARFLPYVQAGAGIVFNDIYKDQSQDAVGQAIEFTPQASLGFRYLIRPRWSLDAEAMFHHISNANFSDRNDGINALGGFIGLTYFFNPRR